jgi:hypothetical protein
MYRIHRIKAVIILCILYILFAFLSLNAMKKTFLSLTLAACLLAACASSTPAAKMPTDSGKAPTEPPHLVPTETLGAALANAPTALPTTAVTDTPLAIKPGDMMPGCTVVSVKPTPVPAGNSVFGPITEQDWVIGPPDATVTLLEFSDFQ